MTIDSAHPRPLRVCVTGAECTGKTTLAEALGARLSVPVIHETVRDYFAEKARRGDASVYASDILHVVATQAETEDRAPLGSPLLVLDTDVFTIAVWAQRYLTHRPTEIFELAARRQRGSSCIDLYLLTAPDLPFEHDGVRGSHESRDQMHEVFAEELAHSGRRYVEVYGDVQA
ncbi:MAG TPA: ATP-binding protein, partial [Coriobacteriia bacterium]|nr:ATP-binding protein [Coriobacteriia bacterium]